MFTQNLLAMKTLIVHPFDTTTEFLSPIYLDLPNKSVVRRGYKAVAVKKMIEQHDRVIMMGHGSPNGLFSVGQFEEDYGFIINHTMIDILNRQPQNIFIWCNADQFVGKYNLKGFYSGMFISEVSEAAYCGLPGIRQEQVDESNDRFAHILGACINDPKETLYNKVKKAYGILAENNPVARYNYDRLYLN